jgi:hypothetical protein
VRNVTPPAIGPRPVTTPTPTARRNQIIALAVFVIVLVLLVRACAGGENRYEKIAHELTQAVQNNDYNAVAKLENVETAAEMGHGRLGHAADVLAPLGKIRRVKENTPAGDGPRVHEFDVRFENGSAHEKIQFDPNDKVFHFAYDQVQKPK